MKSMHQHPTPEHGLPTAPLVRSSQATPERRRGQACTAASATCNNPLAQRVAHPGDYIASVDNTTAGFSAIVDD